MNTKIKIALGSDHAGFVVKKELLDLLATDGFKVIDFGTYSEEASDYPDSAARVAKAVANRRCDRGILFCGSGMGMCIAANKVSGIRAATPWSIKTAKLAARHNWCNVLCVPSWFLSVPSVKKIVHAWLATPFEKGGRHERRVKKILKIESKS